ncbi:MAG: hypothetical protein IPK83_18255 [Planctomycetes bacterium]|nr:hypothetical protein [Planctomycetota bacterium]
MARQRTDQAKQAMRQNDAPPAKFEALGTNHCDMAGVLACIFAGVFVLSLSWFKLSSLDIGYHVAYGRYFLDTGKIVGSEADPFLRADTGVPFVNANWGSQVIMALADRRGRGRTDRPSDRTDRGDFRCDGNGGSLRLVGLGGSGAGLGGRCARGLRTVQHAAGVVQLCADDGATGDTDARRKVVAICVGCWLLRSSHG